MANFQNHSKSFEIWLDTMEIQYWSEFGVIWVFFEGLMVILVTHFSLFFIKANIKEFLVPIFSKKCMQILNFGPNWLIFYRHHLWMVVQKCCVGKFKKIIFWPFFRPLKSKNGHFWSFFDNLTISGTQKSQKFKFSRKFLHSKFLTPYEGGIYGFIANLEQNWEFV